MKRINIRITGIPDSVSRIGFETSEDGLTLILPDEADVEIKTMAERKPAAKQDANVIDFPKRK